MFTFLSGPPDFGSGQLDTRRYGEQYASKREDADLALLPEQTPFYKDLVCGNNMSFVTLKPKFGSVMLMNIGRLPLLFKQVFLWMYLLSRMSTPI